MRMLDLFSGIGGFHLGFERAGFEFEWVGFSEIDKYANAVYRHRFPKAVELGDVAAVRSRDLPKIDLITFGSPCQDFSIAGKRAGAKEGTRSSLIWQAIRLITECQPRIFVWENVKGTFSSNSGADFWAIIQAFTNIGSYRLEWQLINTRWFLPQNRERIYLVGYTGNRSGQSVFPIGEDGECTDKRSGEHNKIKNGCSRAITRRIHKMGAEETYIDDKEPNLVQTFTERSFDGNREDGGRAIRYHKKPGETPCLSSMMGMGGNNVPMLKVGELQITAKKRTHDTPKEINEYLKANKNGKTIKQIAESIDLPKTQVEHYFRSDKCRAIPSSEHWILLKELLGFDDTYDKQVTDIYEKEVEFESSRRVYAADGISKTLDTNETGYYQIPEATKKGYAEAEEGDSINLERPTSKTRKGRVGKKIAGSLETVQHQYTIQPVLTPNRAEKRQNGRRFKEDGEDMFTLTQQDQHGIKINKTSIRRLTPVECMRLQGFPDDWNEFGILDREKVAISDTQRYKQAGNAVTVDVVQAVAEKLRSLKLG